MQETKAYVRARSAVGLHDSLFAYFSREFPKDVSILDCAAGTGLWVARLLKAGYTRIQAIELDEKSYEGGAPCRVIDLDTDFSDSYSEQFDVITAIEIIEHMENPTHFLRECRKLLKPGGALILTTPNIESVPSRIKLLFKGKVKHFGKGDDPTHISPIISTILPRLSARSGLRVDRFFPLVRKWDTRPGLRAISAMMAPFLPGNVYGECHLFVLRPEES
ncbi:MAG TPA: methyltransferase domain-containing protein [Acidobacteriota bacterium]|nr:methyltransferase domain-containing protein [Acidobacteriota bacterium]